MRVDRMNLSDGNPMTMAQTRTKGGKAAGRRSGGRAVYETLRTEILDLTLAPGAPIDEVELAQRFGLSRTPVREALVRLGAEGLVTTLPNRASIVAPIDFLNLGAFFDALTLMYRVSTRLAAEFRDDDDMAAMRRHQASFLRAVEAGDAVAMIDTNRAFHAAIAEAGRNPYYHALFLRLLDDGRRLLRLYYRSFGDRLPRRYAGEHDEMIVAIAAGDIAGADRIATAHADQIVRQIQGVVAEDRRQPIAL